MRALTIHHLVEFLKPLISLNKFINPFEINKIIYPTTILNYHSISAYRNVKYHRHFTIDPQLFNLHMNYLQENNFKVINLAEFYETIQAPITTNHKTIVLTFDDGYADSCIQAYPILKKCRFSATFFLISSLIDSKETFPWLCEPLFPRGGNLPLSMGQISKMIKGGMDFGSHTNSHRRLTQLSQKQAFAEIQRSKTYIQDLLGREINSFSYPYGSWSDFDRSHQEMVRKAGYGVGVTSIYGSNNAKSNPFSLKRIPVYGNDDLKTFEMKINGYYDWIGKAQKVLSLLHSIR